MTAGNDIEPSLLEQTIFSFDIETTGLDPIEDRIVQIGGVFFRRGELVGARRSSLVNPGVPIPPDATAIHGITDADVAEAVSFGAVGPRFVENLLRGLELEEPILCGYNAPDFDVPFINAELNRHGIAHRIDPTQVLDPLVFVRWHHRDWRTRRLESVAPRCGFTIDKAHSAAADAEAAARVLWRLLEDGLVPPLLSNALAAQARFAALLEEEWRRFGNAIYLDRVDSRPRIGFGAHCGKPLDEVDREYLSWCLKDMNDLTDEAKGLIERAGR